MRFGCAAGAVVRAGSSCLAACGYIAAAARGTLPRPLPLRREGSFYFFNRGGRARVRALPPRPPLSRVSAPAGAEVSFDSVHRRSCCAHRAVVPRRLRLYRRCGSGSPPPAPPAAAGGEQLSISPGRKGAGARPSSPASSFRGRARVPRRSRVSKNCRAPLS